MNILTTQQIAPTIKAQLISRFKNARDVVGKKWKTKLAAADPYFNTKAGTDDMSLTAQAINDHQRRGKVDRIKRVVLALEKLANIPHTPIL